MTDREKGRPVTAEEWSAYISEFAHRWEFGSVEHGAVSDFFNLHQLYGEIGQESSARINQVSGKANLSPEDRNRLLVQRIALLEHTIEQQQSRVPGYANAYEVIRHGFESLLQVADDEANKKFATQEEKQKEYVNHIYMETMDYLAETVFDKQNPDFTQSF